MIYDVVPFFNELEVLCARIETLRNVVDVHIITEGTLTHQGRPKSLYLDGALLPGTNAKIERYVVELPSGPNDHWPRERLQREYALQVLNAREMDDDDLIIVTDCDEIWDPTKKTKIYTATEPGPVSLRMPVLWRGIQQSVSDAWVHPKAFRWKDRTLSLTDLRLARYYPQVLNAGWHISHWGDAEQVREQFQSYAHAEHNNEETIERVTAGESLDGERLTPFDVNSLPEPIRRILG